MTQHFLAVFSARALRRPRLSAQKWAAAVALSVLASGCGDDLETTAVAGRDGGPERETVAPPEVVFEPSERAESAEVPTQVTEAVSEVVAEEQPPGRKTLDLALPEGFLAEIRESAIEVTDAGEDESAKPFATQRREDRVSLTVMPKFASGEESTNPMGVDGADVQLRIKTK